MSDSDGDAGYHYELYRYTPSIPAAVVFVVVFALLSIAHLIILIRNRTYIFIPFFIGLLFECAGYAARIASHFDTEALAPYIVQTLLILIAPPLFAASIYMTLGRILRHLHAEDKSIVPVRFLTKIFVSGDVISFLLQAAGGGYMAAGTLSAMETGSNIVIGGLAVQLVFFSLFVFVSALFHWRMKKQPDYDSITVSSVPTRWAKFITWESVMWALYIACALILIRSIFRVVEFVEGNDGFIMKREYLLYIFDAVLMALTGFVLVVIYPGFFLGRGGKRETDIGLLRFSGS
ncbi:RTA1 domain protein [Aspergillus sclerotialis]|uniref:RTA1 domain protein n=1 Tax=Aspergillus sclerotialis TaxID=2070753 RepID=A0A3A2Z576_9EURO|nr:RTA1 domain protein [Aspergillus sclerotialis]